MAHPSVTRLTDLANEISRNTAIITEYLASKSLPATSFDADGLAELPIPPEDKIPLQARFDLAAPTKELHDLTVGPKQSLHDLGWDLSSLSLRFIWEFNVAACVPIDEPISYPDLTVKISAANENLSLRVMNVRRLLRHAMTNRIFCEPTKGYVAHTRSSRMLLEDEPMKNWIGLTTKDLLLPADYTVDAMKKWPCSEEPNETGVNLAFGHNTPWFEFLPTDPVRSKRYNLAMQAHGETAGYDMKDVVDAYPWGDLPEIAKVVDVGGNQGYISFAIAQRFPKLRFVVQDQASMRTPETIGVVPEELRPRVELTTHDFFEPQTEIGAAVYFFRMIFHGFSDKYCVKILRALAPAMRKGGKVVINDGALPEPGTATYLEERACRTLDLLMQVVVNAREREADDWTEIFSEADRRYRVNRVWRPEGSVMSFIEAQWAGE
ncbi:O-methyltransferase-domain-containing protein [Podospora fimiseda]|uniref:O-methyltransferase-domain-containing protein n=1 Tax=Podospora fimiseda TaxID=252190 RepID=A0AAN6YRE0_9PEZI|nr:O-methyltransferase-domain-containing protein [Podospora fimiseda]